MSLRFGIDCDEDQDGLPHPPTLSERGREVLTRSLVALHDSPEPDGADHEHVPTAAARLTDQLGLLTRAQLADLPPIEPLIDETLDRRTLAVLAGYWGTGKSFLGFDWACSIATGHPWQGRPVQVPHGGGHVLYVAAEGAYGIDARITAWETHRQRDVHNLHVIPRAVDLMQPADPALLAEYVTEQWTDLVVIDTLSRCMAGADENTARDMSTAVRHLDWIKDAGDGTCVLVVHHTGKDRTTIRGSSVLEGAADTVYAIEGDSDSMQVSRTKRKDGPREDEHRLGVSPVAGTTSAVILSGVSSSSSSRERVLSGFDGVGASKADLRTVADLPSASFHRGLSALVRDETLINAGTEKRPFYRQANT